MSGRDVDERQVGDLTVRIDRTLCVGFGDCVEAAPGAFELDAENIAVFVEPAAVDRQRLLDACRVCPVDALLVFDHAGGQIVP